MAGLGLAILGGALEETGKGIAEKGKAEREAKLKMLEQDKEFAFRRDLADQEIGAQHTENELNAQDNAADRQANGGRRERRLDKTMPRRRNQEDLAVSGDIDGGRPGTPTRRRRVGKRTKDETATRSKTPA
jgi:hypothetical protein